MAEPVEEPKRFIFEGNAAQRDRAGRLEQRLLRQGVVISPASSSKTFTPFIVRVSADCPPLASDDNVKGSFELLLGNEG